jgi:phenylalanyl-tRNA synthetase beta chain
MTPYTYAPQELSDRLMNLGIEVESIDDRRAGLAGFVVGEVLDCARHPNADKLSLCRVSTGREESTVVCGAPNVAAGQKVVFAPVGTAIPSAGFTIERRKIRGIESVGMICSESELGLGDGHDGILVLPPDTPAGMPVADLLGDVILEIEVTPNRVDCLSHLGIAREVAAMTGANIFLPPTEIVESQRPTTDAITVRIDDPALCPRYTARVVSGVTIGPSPDWLQDILRKLGLRPRNNVVDITSYVLFECGHPLHAFDYDLIDRKTIVVRPVDGGETFTTLDGKEHTLPEGALMICDASKPVAIAGVMGGANSEITDATVNVLIESAYFQPASIRRTAKRLGLSTDASYRFERGTDINAVTYAVDRAASMIAELAGGEILAGIVDNYPAVAPEQVVELRFDRTNQVLGTSLTADEQIEILSRLDGFSIHRSGDDRAMVSIPSYRVDIAVEIDLVEEIARLYGYDAIPSDERATTSFDLRVDPLLKTIEQTRQFLVDRGFTEVATLQMVDPESATPYGEPVPLRNALGRDYSMMRTSLAPSLARVVALNERYSRPDLRLFEVGKVFRSTSIDKGVIPGVVETFELVAVITGAAEPGGWDVAGRASDLYDLRAIAEAYLQRLGITGLSTRPADGAAWGFAAGSLALLVDGEEVGRIGPFDAALLERNRISGAPQLLIIDIERIAAATFAERRYVAPARFPALARDVSIIVDTAVSHADLEGTIRTAGGDLLRSVELFDLYAGKGIEQGKRSLTYALAFSSPDRTLEESEVESAMRNIVDTLGSKHGAVVRGS